MPVLRFSLPAGTLIRNGITGTIGAGSNGISIIIAYAVITIIEALICLWIWRKHCKNLDFDELRKSW